MASSARGEQGRDLHLGYLRPSLYLHLGVDRLDLGFGARPSGEIPLDPIERDLVSRSMTRAARLHRQRGVLRQNRMASRKHMQISSSSTERHHDASR